MRNAWGVIAERGNFRDEYRWREWDARAGTVELAILKLRQDSYYWEWLLERRAGRSGRW